MITHYRLINQRVSLPSQLRSLKKKISSVREIEFNLSPRDLQAIIVCYFAFWNRTRITLLFGFLHLFYSILCNNVILKVLKCCNLPHRMHFHEHCHFSRLLFTINKHTYQLKRSCHLNSIPASYIDIKILLAKCK